MQTEVLVPNLSAIHQQSLKAGELLPRGHFWEFSTKSAPVKGKALGQIIAVAWPPLRICSSSHLPAFSQMPDVFSQHTTAPGCALENLPRVFRGAGTATVLRQLCKAVGIEPAPRKPCCCPSISSVSGALAATFLQQSHEYFYFFLDELAQSPASYVSQN